MSNNSDESLIKAAYGVLKRFQDNLPDNTRLQILGDNEQFVISALSQHGEHLSTHDIHQDKTDPFKILCWLGRSILEGLEYDASGAQQKTIIEALIKSLQEILLLETDKKVKLSCHDQELIRRLVNAELCGNSKHGIGFNGLFIAFHVARSTYRILKQ